SARRPAKAGAAKRKTARPKTGRSSFGGAALSRRGLCGLDARSARALGALLDVEIDLLAAGQAVGVERHVERAAMGEIILPVVGGDEAKSAIGDDLLDGSGGHEDLLHFPNEGGRTHGPFATVDHAASQRVVARHKHSTIFRNRRITPNASIAAVPSHT